MMTLKQLRLIIACLLLSVASYQVQAKPKFPTPPSANITKIGDKMVVNGIAMDIRLFASKDSAEEVLSFYRGFWPEGSEKKPGFTETDALAPWRIITRVEDGYLMTVQVKPAKQKGSSGYLSLSRLPNPEKAPELGKDFPKMRGTYVVNDIQSKDLAKKGRTIVMLNQASVNTNANFYKDHFLNSGWSSEMDKQLSGGNTHTLRFRNGNQNVSIVVQKGSRTSITAQVIKEGLF